jgi:Tol biopolymer transport system component
MTWEGREQTRLTHTEFVQTGELAWPPRNLHPRYSPDGNFIAYASSVHGARGENRFEIYRMQSDGSEQTRLSHTQGSSSYPLWHPNSRQIAFTSWVTEAYTRKKSTPLYLIDVEGSEQRCLEESSSINWMHSFSPEGRFLAFDSTRHEASPKVPDNWDLFLLEMETGQVHTMTDNTVLDKKPIFSPDGKGILFESRRDGFDELYYATIQF